MEGKTVIMGSVLILSLLVAQIQVEGKSCCQSTFGRNCYNVCRIGDRVPRPVCASTCSCKIVEGTTCPAGWQKDILENPGSITEYCKLGCASSMCNAINTLQNSDASEEVVNGAVEQCTKACSAFCTKGSINALA